MTTVRQHTVPRVYLRGFSREDKAWASRKGSGGRFGDPFPASIDGLCAQRYYYEVEGKRSGGRACSYQINSIENWLSSLENRLANPLREVTGARTTDALQDAVGGTLYPMKVLLANLMMRNPTVLDPSRKQSEQLSRILITEGLITREELKAIEQQNATLRDVAEYAIMWMELRTKAPGSSMGDILSWLDDVGVLALRARAGSQLVTADVPFALGWEDVRSKLPSHIYLPLGWRTAVVFHKYDRTFASRYADDPEVDFWNHVLVTRNESTSMVIARSEGAVRRATERCNASELG